MIKNEVSLGGSPTIKVNLPLTKFGNSDQSQAVHVPPPRTDFAGMNKIKTTYNFVAGQVIVEASDSSDIPEEVLHKFILSSY